MVQRIYIRDKIGNTNKFPDLEQVEAKILPKTKGKGKGIRISLEKPIYSTFELETPKSKELVHVQLDALLRDHIDTDSQINTIEIPIGAYSLWLNDDLLTKASNRIVRTLGFGMVYSKTTKTIYPWEDKHDMPVNENDT